MRTLIVTIISVVALTGCSSTPATPSPGTSTPSRVGDTISLASGAVTVEVLDLKPLPKTDRSAQATGALVRTCNISMQDPITPAWSPWSLVTADGEQYKASNTAYGSDPKPRYPFAVGDRTLNRGDCAKGWVVFPTAAKIATIEYDNDAGIHAEWSTQT